MTGEAQARRRGCCGLCPGEGMAPAEPPVRQIDFRDRQKASTARAIEEGRELQGCSQRSQLGWALQAKVGSPEFFLRTLVTAQHSSIHPTFTPWAADSPPPSRSTTCFL